MPSNNESQCYFVQLQIDSYLDGELDEAQQGVFVSHVQDCAACASEFRYAQTVQDSVLELPQIECKDSVLEPVYRFAAEHDEPDSAPERSSIVSRLAELFRPIPLTLRYGVSAAAIAVIAVAVSNSVLAPGDAPVPVVASETDPQYSQEDIAQALGELNVAIDYLNELSQRTEVMIGDRFIVSPIQESINASLEKAGMREYDPLQNGPI